MRLPTPTFIKFVFTFSALTLLGFCAMSVSHAQDLSEEDMFAGTCVVVHEYMREYDKANNWRLMAKVLYDDDTFFRSYKIARSIIDDAVTNNSLVAEDFHAAEETCDEAFAEMFAVLEKE